MVSVSKLRQKLRKNKIDVEYLNQCFKIENDLQIDSEDEEALL